MRFISLLLQLQSLRTVAHSHNHDVVERRQGPHESEDDILYAAYSALLGQTGTRQRFNSRVRVCDSNLEQPRLRALFAHDAFVRNQAPTEPPATSGALEFLHRSLSERSRPCLEMCLEGRQV